MHKHSLKAGDTITVRTSMYAPTRLFTLAHDYDDENYPDYLLNDDSLSAADACVRMGDWCFVSRSVPTGLPGPQYFARYMFPRPRALGDGYFSAEELEEERQRCISWIRRSQREWPFEHDFRGDPVTEGDLHVGWDVRWVRVSE